MIEINNGMLLTLVIMSTAFVFTAGFVIGAYWGAIRMAKKTIAQIDKWYKP